LLFTNINIIEFAIECMILSVVIKMVFFGWSYTNYICIHRQYSVKPLSLELNALSIFESSILAKLFTSIWLSVQFTTKKDIRFILLFIWKCIFHNYELNWIKFWCLTPLSAIFQLYHGDFTIMLYWHIYIYLLQKAEIIIKKPNKYDHKMTINKT